MAIILCISGLIKSGKDTAATYLVENHNFVKLSFASAIKDMLSVIFSWDRNMLDGITEESRLWRDQVDTWWAKKLNIPNFTPRFAMTNIGTDILRNHFNENIWIFSLEKKIIDIIKSTNKNIVISDGRYINELDFIKKMNGTCVKINRGSDPIWMPSAKEYVDLLNSNKNKAAEYEIILQSIPGTIFSMDIHNSEWNLVNYKFDKVINNDGSKNSLYKQMNILLSEIPYADKIKV